MAAAHGHFHSPQARTAACHAAEAVVPSRAAALPPARPCAPLIMVGGPRQAAAVIQAMARGRAARARYRRLCAAAVALQAAWRRAVQRTRFLRLRAAALRLQAAARGARARAEARARRRAIVRIQVPADFLPASALDQAWPVSRFPESAKVAGPSSRAPAWAGAHAAGRCERHCCGHSAAPPASAHPCLIAISAMGGPALLAGLPTSPGPACTRHSELRLLSRAVWRTLWSVDARRT